MSDKPIDIAMARARSLGITPIQLRNRNNPYEMHCPECGERMSIAFIGKGHWDVCEKCRVCYPSGSGLFSMYQEYTDLDRARDRKLLESCRELTDIDLFGAAEWKPDPPRSDIDDLPF